MEQSRCEGPAASGRKREREVTASSTRLAHHCSCGHVNPPLSRPPLAPTAMTDVSKSLSRNQQLAATLTAMKDTGPTDIQVNTDGSTHEGTTDGRAGMVVMSGEDNIERRQQLTLFHR